jgi:hypothetical protein
VSSRTVHLCVNIEGLLKRRNLKGWVTDDNDRELSDAKSRAWLREQLAMGRRVLPFAKECEGFSYQTGCPGHEKPELQGDPFAIAGATGQPGGPAHG